MLKFIKHPMFVHNCSLPPDIHDDKLRAAAGSELQRPVGDAGGDNKIRVFHLIMAVNQVVSTQMELAHQLRHGEEMPAVGMAGKHQVRT